MSDFSSTTFDIGGKVLRHSAVIHTSCNQLLCLASSTPTQLYEKAKWPEQGVISLQKYWNSCDISTAPAERKQD